ncbi:MAG: hypothetical protein NC418_01570 [Muribaculaceae bacterium]|nr:hypothetical protein [Muribaculaceae bacterium]
MKTLKSCLYALLFTLTVAIMPARAATSYLIEGEAFQFKGKWVVEKSSDCLGSAMLRVYQTSGGEASDDALTVINITEGGTYSVWTRSRDYAGGGRARSYTLSVDGKAMAESGAHGREGFYWEKVGTVDLPRKQVLLRISDTGGYYGRCDAIVLSSEAGFDPNGMPNTQLARLRRTPVAMPYTTTSAQELDAALDIAPGYTVLATAFNSEICVSFVRLATGEIVCKTDYYASGSWRRFHSSAEDNRVALISSEQKPAIDHNNFYPGWDRCRASRELNFEGSTYAVNIDGDRTNPYYTGTLGEARATAVTKTSAQTIKVSYDCGERGTLTGYWTVPESGAHVDVRMVLRPAADGMYSIALHAAKGIVDESVDEVLLPPMFQYRRLPSTALMMLSSMTTQCLSAVQTTGAAGPATAFVCASPDVLGSDWGGYDYSPAGFTLRGSDGLAEAVMFSPCPGMKDSFVKAGRTLESNFTLGICSSDMAGTLAYVSDNIFGMSDYRRPLGCSLTATMHNVAELIKDDEYSGWNAAMKGFWDIEADGNIAPTVVQSAPLALLAAAAMGNDEDMYERRALPAIEYMLSRRAFRTADNAPAALDAFSSQFPTTAYEGINTLTGGLNPWLAQVAMPGGELRAANGWFTTVQPFRQALSAYRLTGDASYLAAAEAMAESYIGEMEKVSEVPFAHGTFYSSQIITPWQSLMDMYEATGKEHYATAAAKAATQTLAGVRTWPKPAEGELIVHPGGSYDGITTVWWKGAEQYRLGFPRTEGDAPEHEVEAWKVSPVGLGIEQPATYFIRSAGKTSHPIYMSSWAPGLLALTGATGSPIYETYARNAVVGRAESYPGYYATGYTDIPLSADFPRRGPDVSSIYYHHLPAYYALLHDFLVKEFVVRSGGEINFPSARQEGFVWFSNNLYGSAEGEVYGRKATLWMPADAFSCDNPDINILSARTATGLIIMLTADGTTDQSAKVRLADYIAAAAGADIALLEGEGKAVLDGAVLSVDVPCRGLAVVEIDLDMPAFERGEALTDGFRTIDTGTAAGKIRLYRIRSPFGWDSVYGFAECADIKNLEIEAECRGTIERAGSWPYEWSFSRFAADEVCDVKITVKQGGEVLYTAREQFAPMVSGVENVAVESTSKAPEGIYRIDGTRVEAVSAPGVYIVDGKKLVVK